MSDDAIRKIACTWFSQWGDIHNDYKTIPNRPKSLVPKQGNWAKLKIDFLGSRNASIGSSPCISTVGSIRIEIYEHLDEGVKRLTGLSDSLKEHMQNRIEGNLQTGAGSTYDHGELDKGYYMYVVDIPFRYY